MILGKSGEKLELDMGSAVVHPWHLDQFGHMNVRWYAHFFDDASFQFLERLGLSLASGRDAHCVTARTTTEFKRELLAGTCLRVLGSLQRIGRKSVTLRYRMVGAGDGQEFASCETIELFVDAETHQSIEIPKTFRRELEKLATGPADQIKENGEVS